MPIIEITIAQPRDPAQIQALLRDVHDAVVRSLEVPSGKVRVIIHEIPATHFSVAGVTKADQARSAAVAR